MTVRVADQQWDGNLDWRDDVRLPGQKDRRGPSGLSHLRTPQTVELPPIKGQTSGRL